jgi:hypothetical protein
VAALEAASADATAVQDMPPHALERHGESLRLGLACLGAAAAAAGSAGAAGPATAPAAAAVNAAAARLEAALAAVGAERPPEQACAQAGASVSQFHKVPCTKCCTVGHFRRCRPDTSVAELCNMPTVWYTIRGVGEGAICLVRRVVPLSP